MKVTLQTVDIIVIVIYIATLLAMGLQIGAKKNSDEDIFLAGRSLRWPVIGFSIFSTNVTALQLIASCEASYKYGVAPFNFEWLAWIFLFLLGIVFVTHYLNTRITTMPEFIKLRFGRASHRFLSFYALLSIIVFWLGTTLFAGAFVLSEILDWSLITSILFLTVTATSFTFLGGLAAIVRTEIFQSVLIIIATTILTVLAFNEVGSIDNLVAKVPTDYWELLRPSDDKNYPWQGFILGYPVLGIWFWCAEQTIVQRVLAAKNIKEAQLGTIFTSFLKVIMPFILFFPGILAYALFPEMADPRNAYLALITNVLPIGLVGLVIAALIATLTGSIASGINSFSTVFTLDIYKNFLNPTADNNKLKRTGQIMTLVAAVLSMVFAYLLSFLEQGLFDLLQGIISFFAPPISAVFLIGVLWKRATPIAAFLTFVLGTITCLTTGYFYLTKQGMFGLFNYEDFPHFLILSFYLFAGLSIFMIIVSLVTKQDKYINFPTLAESYLSGGNTHNRLIWTLWAAVAVMMGALYLIF